VKIRSATWSRPCLVCLLGTAGLFAQQSSGAAAPKPPKIQVDAPFAQQLIVKEKAMHPEIQKLGLHAVPPGQTQNAIIASNLPEKIGKVSAPSDLQLVAAGEPQAEKIDKEGYWDTFVPLHDHNGAIIGFLVMEVPFSTTKTHDGAIDVGTSIRNEVQQQAPTLESLFAASPHQ
jgi:hypothetical protein